VTVLAWGALFGVGTLRPSLVQAETNIIPSVAVSERYDTNVFFAPKELLTPGTRLDDYVSSLIAGVELKYKTPDVDVSLKAGGDVNWYAYNKTLNYIGTNEVATAKLDGWVARLLPGARLTLSDLFRYTPQPPGFLSPTQAPAAGSDPFSRGVQNFRANNYSNTFSANGTYPVYRDLFVQGIYTWSKQHVGSILAGNATGAAFFDTTVHSYSVGPGYRLTPVDNISLTYQQSFVTQTQTNGTSPELSFNTQEVWTNYTREAQDWKATVRGGVTYLEPAGKAIPTVWVTFNSNPERRTTVQLDLSRKAGPSYFLVGGASISNVAQISLTHKLTRRLNLTGNAGYAYGETTPVKDFKYTSITTSAGLSYDLTRTMSGTLSYSYQHYDNEFPGLTYNFNRNVVAFFLTARWE